MLTIAPYNTWQVSRELSVVTNNLRTPLMGAVVIAEVWEDEAGTISAGITPINLIMGYPGIYEGSFDQAEVDAALLLAVADKVVSLYEVVRTQDGSYRDIARLRVTADRYVSPGASA